MERFLIKSFARWANKEGVSLDVLQMTIAEMQRGLVGNKIGADLYKKRLPLLGRGKSSGARVIVFFRNSEMIVFLYGYKKNMKDSLTPIELEALRIYTKDFIKLTDTEIMANLKNGELIRI